MAQELTLEMSGPAITADKFEQGIRHFLALIKDVSRDVSQHKKAVKWLVNVEPGSVRVNFIPVTEKSPDSLPRIVQSVSNGLRILEGEPEKPPHFSDRAMTNARALASIVDHGEEGVDSVRVLSNGSAVSLTGKTVAHVAFMIGAYSKDWGTIEGRLAVISERHGYSFMIYDSLTDKPTRCHFPDSMLPRVIDAFGKNVAVSGLIRYRRNGEPMTIKVTERDQFRIFQAKENLPTVSELCSGFKGNNN